MLFRDFPYERIPLDPLPRRITELLSLMKAACSGEQLLALYGEFDAFQKKVLTMFALCEIRHCIDTQDRFYGDENDYCNQNMPKMEQLLADVSEILLQSPFRKELEAALGSVALRNMEMSKKAVTPAILSEMQEENQLETQYETLMAGAQIPFQGAMLTLPQLAAYQESPNRAIREAAYRAENDFMVSIGDRLDDIFDQMVKVRTRLAQKLGYQSFTQVAYLRLTRNCYDQDAVARLRQEVAEHIVPFNTKLLARQAKRNGISEPKVWDRDFVFPEGNPAPVGSAEDIFQNGQTMYRELSPETEEFFDFMLEHELFDVLSKKGKANGGFCTSLPDFDAPFVFANFNGTSGDIEVLTHECGHALEDYIATRSMGYTAQKDYTMDIAEIHSMSMEFFTYPWMPLFFKENTEKFYFAHIFSALKFLPYGCMVDHFQHIVYDNPDLTPSQRHAEWAKLEKLYRPDLNPGDLAFLEKGGAWQQKQHIFLNPFYYIDYCFAQIIALYFWDLAQTDRKEAWNRYLALLKKAGTKDYITLVKEAGFVPPTEAGAIASVAQTAYDYLTRLEKNNFQSN